MILKGQHVFFLICVTLVSLPLCTVRASEAHEDEASTLLETAASNICGLSHTSEYNEVCFKKIIVNFFQRFSWCNSKYSSCFLCNKLDALGNALFTNQNTGGLVKRADMEKTSIALMVLLHDVKEYCTDSPNVVPTTTYSGYWSSMSSEQKFKDNKTSWLEHVYEDLAKNFNKTLNTKCITSKSIISESEASKKTANEDWAKAVSLFSVLHILDGYQLDGVCVTLPSSTSIVNSLYATLGLPSQSSRIPEEGIKKIMTALGIGNAKSETTDSHEGHNHRRKRSVSNLHRVRRATVISDKNVTQCLSVDNLFSIYGVDETAGVSFENLKNLCPAMLQQKLSGLCTAKTSVAKQTSKAEAYGFGALAVFVISFGSLVGAVFIPCMKTKVFDLIMLFAVTLAIGTLLSDALLHLIPEAVGLHVHAHAKGFQPPKDYFWKMFVLICVIYVLYIIELILSYWFSNWGHSHITEMEMENFEQHSNIAFQGSVENVVPGIENSKQNSITDEIIDAKKPEKEHSHKVQSSRLTAFFVIGGDTIHNFADGLAIGAAFSSSISSGLSTSLAILCHELPHELGDFAILLSSRLSVKKALLINLLSAFSAFIGLFIGVPVASLDGARHWIFTVTAGIFIYISLCNMLSSTKETRTGSKVVCFFVQIGGFLTGIIIILLIGLFESQIQI